MVLLEVLEQMALSSGATPRADAFGEASERFRFGPVDIVQMRLLAKLPPGRRIGAMLAAQELARACIVSRLRRQYPEATPRELAAKLVEEVGRAGRRPA